jgi:hypothetical protein
VREEIHINELIAQTQNALRKHGINADKQRLYLVIKNYHARLGQETYNYEFLQNMIAVFAERLEKGEIGKSYLTRLRRAIRQLVQFHDTSELELHVSRRPFYLLNQAFEAILAEFLLYRKTPSGQKPLSEGSLCISRGAISKYLSYLLEKGHERINTVTEANLLEFITYCSGHLGGSALSNVVKELRQFHNFLEMNNKLTIPCKRAFMFPIIQEKKILPAFSIISPTPCTIFIFSPRTLPNPQGSTGEHSQN